MTDQFDLFGGRAGRDEGIASVAANNREWMRIAIVVVHRLPRGWLGLCEDIRPYIEDVAGRPTRPNAYGALIRECIKRGLLQRTGERRPMRWVKSHARMTDELRRT